LTDLKKTPLHQLHEQAGARLIDFGGWLMPVQYRAGIKSEHQAVRENAGLFDVSHMGEVIIRGNGAEAAVQKLVTNDVGKLDDGQAHYTVMCYPNGGIVDDLIVYRRSQDNYFLVVNASNKEKDLAWIRENVGDSAEVIDESDSTALIAVQGPNAVALVDSLSSSDLTSVGRFHHTSAQVAGIDCAVARTGYTGEDGFEIACAWDDGPGLWSALLEANGKAQPVGLGARDTLRLEARLSLYGNDIDETTSPYEAGLGWVVKLDAGDFVGRDALAEQKQSGIKRKLVGFKMTGRGIPRHGYEIVDRSKAASDQVIGHVTSGNSAITVGGAIGMGYVPIDSAKADTILTINCRGKDAEAVVVKGPFYRASR
jgi:aminomethyltransferase